MSGGTATFILIHLVIINLSTERLIFVLAKAARREIVFGASGTAEQAANSKSY
jgi:hypothetical protein